MKKTYVVQLIIDVVMISFALCIYLFPSLVNEEASTVFFITMIIYAGLELCEYAFDRTRLEPLYIFFSSLTAAFSSIFLRNYAANYVLSGTLAVWLLLISIIKIINLKEVYPKKTHLFLIKLGIMSSFALLGILVSINIFYRVSVISYMLALLYMSYGILEFIGDFLMYLSEDIKFLKE